ncbi:hypothetical protein R3P38DRAFT_3498186 [Favolaschia claudopus]|uniref:Uncharacterized protein n=1 Tax=Favolaschia claudopus TaxID=2862362 RepID=A0AAW0C7Q7_9AGAR
MWSSFLYPLSLPAHISLPLAQRFWRDSAAMRCEAGLRVNEEDEDGASGDAPRHPDLRLHRTSITACSEGGEGSTLERTLTTATRLPPTRERSLGERGCGIEVQWGYSRGVRRGWAATNATFIFVVTRGVGGGIALVSVRAENKAMVALVSVRSENGDGGLRMWGLECWDGSRAYRGAAPLPSSSPLKVATRCGEERWGGGPSRALDRYSAAVVLVSVSVRSVPPPFSGLCGGEGDLEVFGTNKEEGGVGRRRCHRFRRETLMMVVVVCCGEMGWGCSLTPIFDGPGGGQRDVSSALCRESAAIPGGGRARACTWEEAGGAADTDERSGGAASSSSLMVVVVVMLRFGEMMGWG